MGKTARTANFLDEKTLQAITEAPPKQKPIQYVKIGDKILLTMKL